jgi:lycopene cyclase domain-containing protein
MPEYTILATLAVLAVVAAEHWWWRSGIFRNRSYWTKAICLFFMVLVNGRLTWLEAPVVLYDDGRRVLPRFPLDIPMEDYLFGFALLSAVCARWEWLGRRPSSTDAAADGVVRS